jgi:5-methylcytosine-specific restriction endonuclease McrA
MTTHMSPAWDALNKKYLDGVTLCAYGCGRVAVTGDHITPRSKGGEDTEENYAPCCRTCNSRKGNRPAPRSAIRTQEHITRMNAYVNRQNSQ